RRCPRAAYGPDWLLVPTSTDCGPGCRTGTQCGSPEECTDAPFGHCIGLAEAVCSYDVPTAQPERCDVDADCTRGHAGRCVREIRSTFCLYDPCLVDADCGAEAVCQCGDENAGPVCVTLGCDSSAECDPGQFCRTDESFSGVWPER